MVKHPRAIRSQAVLAGALMGAIAAASAADTHTDTELSHADLARLSIEELANTPVMSVSRRPQPVSDAPASIYVITADQIRRSGSATLPEALRLAPNLQVARVDARNYAITARGFNNAFANKLLVMIDGRSIYSPFFSGVYWDAQDVVLEDIERIEVISGPGATMWGANAVNGVINIITKSAAATTGTLAVLGAQSDLRTVALRHGARLSPATSYRVYAKSLDQDNTFRANGSDSLTGYERHQAGFRVDTVHEADAASIHGDAYKGRLQQQGTRAIEIAGANLLARVSRQLADGGSASVQAYWDFTERDQPNAFVQHLNTIDLTAQHSFSFADVHQLVWGAAYRRAEDRIVNSSAFAFLPAKFNMHWASAFVQDDIALGAATTLSAGLKLEHNNYTGLETLPTLRLSVKPTANTLLWSSLSRSVRAPSRIDRDFFSPGKPPVVDGRPRYVVAGGPDFDAEVAKVAELGMRTYREGLYSVSLTAFHSSYSRLRTLEPNPNGAGLVFRNLAEGQSRGLEFWGSYQMSAAWRLSGGAVFQKVDTALLPGSRDGIGTTGLATSDPSNYWTLQSAWDISPSQSLNLTLRHQGKLEAPAVPAYTAADLSYLYALRPGLSLNIVGRNLFDPAHPEYGGAQGRSEYRRGLYVKLVWQH